MELLEETRDFIKLVSKDLRLVQDFRRKMLQKKKIIVYLDSVSQELPQKVTLTHIAGFHIVFSLDDTDATTRIQQ